MDIRYDDTFSVVCQIICKVVGVTSSESLPVQREPGLVCGFTVLPVFFGDNLFVTRTTAESVVCTDRSGSSSGVESHQSSAADRRRARLELVTSVRRPGNFAGDTAISGKPNSHRHARHDADRTVLSCLVWRCELSRPDSPAGAFCVRSVSECVGRRSATAGRTPTQNALVWRSVHTATPDKTRLPRLPVDRRRDADQAGSYA